MTDQRSQIEQVRARVDLVDVVRHYVQLKKAGREWAGCCPFHDERTPSFYVNGDKGFVHCFGCGAHHDLFGFLQRITGRSFAEVLQQLGGGELAHAARDVRAAEPPSPIGKWIPITPVPDSAPAILADGGWTVPIWNPKSERMSRLKPVRVDAYRAADGQLLGYVLRMDLPGKAHTAKKARKWTPQVTWCVGPSRMQQWCLQAFASPRPLCGLDDLATKPLSHVLLVEGEKCREAGASAFPTYAVLAWPGGSNGIGKVDWRPLIGRDVVLWPDADDGGRKAMLGHRDGAGVFHPGVAQFLHRLPVRSIRFVDPEGQPKGWDIADAIRDGWTPGQLASWAAHRVADVDVVRG